jgi:poly(3-hydroxybutyrate) depolymerase
MTWPINTHSCRITASSTAGGRYGRGLVGRQHAQQAAVLIDQWRGLDGLEAGVAR